MTPFTAGLGQFVDLDKSAFIGKRALESADKRRRTWGLRVPGAIARLGDSLLLNGSPAGRVCSSAWSPFQRCGVAIVRLHDADVGPDATLDVQCASGDFRRATVCDTPMYDENREIPRGLRVDVPEIPSAEEA